MSTLPHSRRAAFSVFAVLLLLGLAAACAFSLSAQSLRHAKKNETRAAIHAARSAALAGTRIALGELQALTGTDACATAPIFSADSGTAPLLGAWNRSHSEKGLPECTPLVSNRGIFSKTRSCRITDKSKMSVPAKIPWETLGENARFAYFIIDESQRASIAKRERDSHLHAFRDDAALLQRLRQQISRRSRLEAFFENDNPDAPEFREKIAAAPCERIFLAALRENLPKKRRSAAKDALTFDARGVPADWQRRQLKTDLSDPKNFSELTDFFPENTLKDLLGVVEIPLTGTPVATDPPAPEGKLGAFSHPFPLLTELKVHLGFFNPRTDGQHRTRFHVTARFWNPYAFPLLAHGDGRLGLFDAKNLPLIRIENQNTGGEVLFSPTDFPVGQFGLVRQTPSDKTCNAYCRIFDASDQGFRGNAAGLHAGEVFLARFPDPQGQAVGLARNLGGTSWKYQKNLARIDKPPAGAKPGAWFHPAHIIRIESLPTFFPASFLVRGDAGSLRQQTDPRDYSDPVFEFRNVPLPPFEVEISGEDYNRANAGDYDISQALLVWKIRLKAEDAVAMNALFAAVEPRFGVFDFNVPAVRNAFEILSLTGADAEKEAEIGGNAESAGRNPSPLRDRFPNAHATQSSNAFSCVRLFDAPHAPALSVGTFRHVAFSKLPPHAGFGAPIPENLKSEKISPNAIFDRAYFSAGPHPHYVFDGEHALISGAFNINSENAEAWATVLGHNVPEWKNLKMSRGKLRPVGAVRNFRHAFFELPFSAQIHPAGTTRKIYTDEEFSALSQTLRKRAFAEQNLREVAPETLENFAETLAEEIRIRRKHGSAPFRSLEEFADSGILEKAIRKSGLNRIAGTEIPSWFPSAISPAALMESLAPTATPRGDTFTILCRAEIFHPFSGKTLGSACAEMRVQRKADFFDAAQNAGTPFDEQNVLNRTFGRRYEITAFRWIPHDEL